MKILGTENNNNIWQREAYLPVKREKKMHQNGVSCTDIVPRMLLVTVLQGRLIIQDKVVK